jgi:hypothetical protein
LLLFEQVRTHAGRADEALALLQRRASELGRAPGVRDVVVLRDDFHPDRLASLSVFDVAGAPPGNTWLPPSVTWDPMDGHLSDPPIVRLLVPLWSREFDAEGRMVVMAELVTHASTARHFADLVIPLALRGVGQFAMKSLRICRGHDEPARFFVVAELPSPAVRDAYVASSFRREEVLPIIGPYHRPRPPLRHDRRLAAPRSRRPGLTRPCCE